MAVIFPGLKKEDFLFGIRHLAQYTPFLVPNFQVFRYIGRTGHLFVFQHIKNKGYIWKTFQQLNHDGFRPFCLDFARVQNYLEDTENAS